MPAPEISNGRAYIWIIACILFICIVAGGGCLVAYLLLPQDQVSSWLPVAGVILVCLPWTFWLLTFIYRIVSRAFGFRVRFGGGGGIPRNYPANEDVEGVGGHANCKGDAQIGGLKRTLSVASNESEKPLAKLMNNS